jgi:glycerol-3-phosphate acyltransferase PlsY
LAYWLLVLLGYFIGTFPTAYIFGRKLKGIDIRQAGDKNMGARNAYFEISRTAGILTAIIDGLKGLLSILIAKWMNAPEAIVLWVGVGCILGHNFPVFLKFQGGRGEAVTIGILVALVPLQMLIVGPVALLGLIIFKKVVLSSALYYIGIIIVCWIMGVSATTIFYIMGIAIIVAMTHWLRVSRLRRPTGTA